MSSRHPDTKPSSDREPATMSRVRPTSIAMHGDAVVLAAHHADREVVEESAVDEEVTRRRCAPAGTRPGIEKLARIACHPGPDAVDLGARRS